MVQYPVQELFVQLIFEKLFVFFWKIFFNPSIFFGLGLYFLSALIYIKALKTIPLSIAYPSLSLSYVAVVLIGGIFFDETLHRIQIIGLLLIILGVMLMWVKR